MEQEDVSFELDSDDLEPITEQPADNPAPAADTPPAKENPGNTTPVDKVVTRTDGDLGDEFSVPNTQEQPQNAPAPQVAKTDEELAVEYNVPVETIQQAKAMGWAGRESWKGNPADFKGPAEFVRIAEESPKILRERNLAMAKEIADMKRMMPQILEIQKKDIMARNESLKKDVARLEKELADAKMLADAERASELTKELMETKIKQALTVEESKNLEKQASGNPFVAPGRDIEREKQFRDQMLPRMSLEQRAKWNQTVNFLDLPSNDDQTTDQRIAYIRKVVFGIESTPQATPVSPVGKPSGFGGMDNAPNPSNNSKTSVWDSMPDEDKRAAIDLIESVPWYRNRNEDPETFKREMAKFKQGFEKYKGDK